jgi:hypothetical protein
MLTTYTKAVRFLSCGMQRPRMKDLRLAGRGNATGARGAGATLRGGYASYVAGGPPTGTPANWDAAPNSTNAALAKLLIWNTRRSITS